MTTSTLSLGLLLLLLTFLGACWAGKRVMAGRAPAPAVALLSTSATPALAPSTPAPASLTMLATALRMPHGASPEELLAMLARDRAQPDLDPQLDDAGDVLRVGAACGACDAVPFIAALALARTAALEGGAPVLCVSNEDPAVRAVALVRPMA